MDGNALNLFVHEKKGVGGDIRTFVVFYDFMTSSSCLLECKHMTLAITMLKLSSPYILKHKTIIKCIQICLSKCHNVEFFHLKVKSYLC